MNFFKRLTVDAKPLMQCYILHTLNKIWCQRSSTEFNISFQNYKPKRHKDSSRSMLLGETPVLLFKHSQHPSVAPSKSPVRNVSKRVLATSTWRRIAQTQTIANKVQGSLLSRQHTMYLHITHISYRHREHISTRRYFTHRQI